MIGLTTMNFARNSHERWRANDLGRVNRFERAARKHASVIMWYADFKRVKAPPLGQLAAVADRGAIPEITWEPWDSRKGLSTPQPHFRLRRIIAGKFDRLIRRWARRLATYGGPVRLRFGHEMNGRWYPWSEDANGNLPGEFVKAWRHVHDIFADEAATNVEWVWSPGVRKIKDDEYPGNRYVDRVGFSVFNGGVQRRFRPWMSYEELTGKAVAQLKRLAPGKPIEISEVGVAERGGNKARWIREMFRTIRRTPEIDTVVWFNLRKGSDWRIQSSKKARKAFARAVKGPRFGQTARIRD
jgi:beta-mannanase